MLKSGGLWEPRSSLQWHLNSCGVLRNELNLYSFVALSVLKHAFASDNASWAYVSWSSRKLAEVRGVSRPKQTYGETSSGSLWFQRASLSTRFLS